MVNCSRKYLDRLQLFSIMRTILQLAKLAQSPQCLGGEIGRRSGFKIRRWKQRVGSSPTLGTTSLNIPRV